MTDTTAHSEAGPRRPRAFVFAPSPLLTVTVERTAAEPEVHLHPGGQGFWIARLMAELGVEVRLCGSFGGEVGEVVRHLMEVAGVAVRSIEAAGSNGAYVHDRRTGERVIVAQMRPAPLSRHEVDELYGAALVEGLEADVCVLGGPTAENLLPAETYRRLATDLCVDGKTVIADLSGEALDQALAGGLAVAKVSGEELQRDGRLGSDDPAAVVTAMEELSAAGSHAVVVSREAKPVMALVDGQVLEVRTPKVEAVDTRGAGDSLTAGVAAGMAHGEPVADALRLGTAAGALNVTRRGLGTGRREEIERLARHVEVRPLACA